MHQLAQIQHLVHILGIAAAHHRDRVHNALLVVKHLVRKELRLVAEDAQPLGDVAEQLLEGHDYGMAHFQAVEHPIGQTQVALADRDDVVGEGARVRVRVLLHGDAEKGRGSVLGLKDGERLAEIKLLRHGIQVVEAICGRR